MSIPIFQSLWVQTRQLCKWTIEISSQWIDLSFSRSSTTMMIEIARREKSWNAQKETAILWRLWEALSNALPMTQQTQRYYSKALTILWLEILFHWLWQASSWRTFRMKLQDSWMLWILHNAVLTLRNAELQTSKILSITCNKQWRLMTITSQRFARWLTQTLKSTTADDDDSSRADSELIISETPCNDEVWDCITMTQRT